MSSRPRTGFSGLWIGIAINVAIGLLLVAVIVASAWRENHEAENRAREQVHFGLADIRLISARLVNDYGWWDEAYIRIQQNGDVEWADEYLAEWLGNTADLAFAVALDPADNVLFTWPEGAARELFTFARLAEQARALSPVQPRAVTEFHVVNGRPMLLAASILRPREIPEGKPMRSVLIFGWDLEANVLPHLRQTTRMPEIRLVADGSPGLALSDVNGHEVARLGWTAEQPGTQFLMWVLPATGGALALVSIIAWGYWSRARRHWVALVAADDTKVRLLAAISHDLRQPLQSLSLFANVLEGEAQSERGEKAVAALKMSVERMGQLLEAILGLARLDMRVGVAERRAVGLDEVLAPVVGEMRPQAEAKGLGLRYVPSSARAMSDPVLLGTMTRNLVANALRYTERGRVLVGCRRRRGAVEIWVCDTGIGIAPEKQALIFEEFYQVANHARDFRQGVGLGLAIVDRLARMLGHRVGLVSNPGRGSCFTIQLKAATPSLSFYR